MKYYYKKALFLLFAFGTCFSVQAQMNYTNLEWVDRTPIVGNSIYHTSTIVQSGNLIVTGNTLNGNSDTDVMVIKYDTNGDTLWMATHNGTANGDDYGVDLKADASGNVYVAAAVKNTSTGYDYCVLKYNSSGTLQWSYTWNGAGSGDDIPTAITIDGAGAIGSYVVGLSEATNGLSDYGMIKVSYAGALSWSQYYNYNNLHDGASGFAGGGPFTTNVTGVSAAAAGDWDIATLTLSKSNGSISATNRTNVSGATMEEAFAMTTDSLNNVYITGYALTGDKDIQTVKLDSNLALVWIVNYAGSYDEEGKDIGVDDNGNVYVTGYTEIANGGTNFILIKYSSSGTEQWVRQIGNSGIEENAEAEKMVVTPDGDVYLTGTVADANGSKMMFVKYDTNGDIKIGKDFQSDTLDYEAYDINISGDEIYITGVEKTIDSTRLTVIKYQTGIRNMEAILDTNDMPMYVDNELIIAFDKDSIITSAIDNKDLTFGDLSDFVKPGTIQLLQTTYSSVDWSRVKTYKIFKGLTTLDTISTTRQGHQIPVTEFWATLLIEVDDEDEVAIVDAIDSVLSPYIQYAQLNYLAILNTNDTHYGDQYSLTGASYPDGDINIGPAWSREVGQSHIFIGVYDSGVMYSHEDLGGVIDPISGKIRGGKDYYNDIDLSLVPNNGDPAATWYSGHGTKVAGIIGAYTNNSLGVAGIGGGTPPNKGVSIYGFRITYGGGNWVMGVDGLTAAVLEGSINTNEGYGYGLHAMNCSFSVSYDYDSYSNNLWNGVQNEIYRNGVILVASKGNENTGSDHYPAHAIKEYWVISVGGSGNNGERHSDSNYADEMDIIAPASLDMIISTGNGSNSEYTIFDGTSAAAAHVTGVVGLMLSYINGQTAVSGNLTPDDVEFLLQRYADDKVAAPAASGYDQWTGWGLMNAGSVFDKIDKTQYVIRHYYGSVVFNTGSATCLTCGGSYALFYNFMPNNGYPFGDYKGDVWEVSGTHSHTLNPGDIILNSWALNYYTNLLNLNIYADVQVNYRSQMSLSNVTSTSATWTGRIMHILEDPNGNPVDFWFPFAPGQAIKYGYTLHLESDYASLDESPEMQEGLTIYPNPTTSNLLVSFNIPSDSNVLVEVIDLQGRIVFVQEEQSLKAGQQKINIDLCNLTDGVYVIKLTSNGESSYGKFVKE